MKRSTHLATFFASLARVMGPGGLRKSFVGICRLHGRYPGHLRTSQKGGYGYGYGYGVKGPAHLNTDGNTGSPPLKDGFFRILEMPHTRTQSIGQWNATFLGAMHPKIYGRLQICFFDISSTITVCVGHIHLLWYKKTCGWGRWKLESVLEGLLLLPVSICPRLRVGVRVDLVLAGEETYNDIININ